MRKLAVIFPGIGYTPDRSLLYYSGRLAADRGYEVLRVAYGELPSVTRGDRARMEAAFALALKHSAEKLSDMDLCAFEEILFIGKSIGTIVATKLASESPVRDRIRLILFTPLPDTFAFSFGEAIAFSGAEDPWTGREKSRIRALCKERGIPCAWIPAANHSLESADVFADLQVLCKVMEEIGEFL